MAADLQAQKHVVQDLYAALDRPLDAHAGAVLQHFVAADWRWSGVHPFGEQQGAEAVLQSFWRPLHNAFTALRRRQDIFFAGISTDAGGEDAWVVSMGQLIGLFDRPWLGIRPTGRLGFLGYAEFNRVVDGRITETVLVCDILKLMWQAGQYPLPPQTGAMLQNPGPWTNDGLLYAAQPPREGEQTLALIDRMLAELLDSDMHSPPGELSSSWHPDMCWWGPAGIGATRTIERYEQQHQGPFNAGLGSFDYPGHRMHCAEGSYGALYGVMQVRSTGGFMGLPAHPAPVTMPVIDVYRREGDKLAENWIFIDMLRYLHEQGLDVLGRTAGLDAPAR